MAFHQIKFTASSNQNKSDIIQIIMRIVKRLRPTLARLALFQFACLAKNSIKRNWSFCRTLVVRSIAAVHDYAFVDRWLGKRCDVMV